MNGERGNKLPQLKQFKYSRFMLRFLSAVVCGSQGRNSLEALQEASREGG